MLLKVLLPWSMMIGMMTMNMMDTVCGKANKKKKNKEPRIGIVGGGASGVYLGYELFYEYGLTDITIIEKGDNASASAVSWVYDNKTKYALDLGTIFVPAASFKILDKTTFEPDGSGSYQRKYYDIDYEIYSPIKQLIDKYNLQLQGRSSLWCLDANDTSHRKRALVLRAFKYAGYDISPLPKNMLRREKLRKEIINVLNLLEPLYELDYFTIADIYNLGICNKGEMMHEWAERRGFPMVSWFLMFAADMSGMGPTYNSTAAAVLRETEKFRIPYFIMLLNYLFVFENSERISNMPWIRSLLHYNGDGVLGSILSPTYYTYKTGYQSFWDHIVDDIVYNSNKKIKFKNNQEVVEISKISKKKKNKIIQCGSKFYDKNAIIVKTKDNIKYEFDYVFISARRDTVVSILDKESFRQEHFLYESYATETVDYYAALYKLTNQNQWFSHDGVYPVFPYAIPVGTNDITKVYTCEPFYMYIFNDAKYLVAFGFVDNSITDITICSDNLFDKLVSQDGLGIEDLERGDLILEKRWNLGSQFTAFGEQNNVFEQVFELQGRNGIFYIGETVAGFTAPNQIDFVKRFSKEWVDIMMMDVDDLKDQCMA